MRKGNIIKKFYDYWVKLTRFWRASSNELINFRRILFKLVKYCGIIKWRKKYLNGNNVVKTYARVAKILRLCSKLQSTIKET